MMAGTANRDADLTMGSILSRLCISMPEYLSLSSKVQGTTLFCQRIVSCLRSLAFTLMLDGDGTAGESEAPTQPERKGQAANDGVALDHQNAIKSPPKLLLYYLGMYLSTEICASCTVTG
jgi:hypothetical protein